ncbi:MAG: transcription elongation factor GreAB [Verrucomicrobia bacterium GWF2_51_19]|nr:MAG: transcription elongation factor GreAB [Verrucomicrobia bacterium GWF2_51_19]HCJ12027.1 transcription elongation factor GreAB [Opitutae bacterium]
MNKEAIELILKKNPKLQSAQGKLETFKEGAYCMHRSWGLGRIQRYDDIHNRLIIDFGDGKTAHPMDPEFCILKLDILPESNILVRFYKEPKLVEEMLKKNPVNVVVELLLHCKDQTATASEIERFLEHILKDKFKKWWTQTKKALAKDSRIAIPDKKTGVYSLREIPIAPEQEVLEEFYINRNPKKKIQLAEKLYRMADSVQEIEADLPKILGELTTAIQEAHQLTHAERLLGCWTRNDLARHLDTDVDTLQPTSKSLILETKNLSELAEELPSHYYQRLLDLVAKTYPEDWKEVILRLLKYSTNKFTHDCITFLMERDCKELLQESFKRWLDEQSMRASVLLWIVKNRTSRKYTDLSEKLLNHNLLSAIFHAVDYEALNLTGSRRIALAEYLVDDSTLVQDLLKTASEEVACDLAQTLLLNQGFEVLSKRSLLARFIKLFPKVQKLLAGEAEEQKRLVVSAESLDIRKKEYETLINQKIPENKSAISIARELGDLRENSEYKMARQDQDTLLARKAQLEKDISLAAVSDFKDAPTDVVGIGSVVHLFHKASGKQHTYAILGAWDSDPDNNVLSYKTPLGQSLLSKHVGETVKTEIAGNEEEWTIQSIARYVNS